MKIIIFSICIFFANCVYCQTLNRTFPIPQTQSSTWGSSGSIVHTSDGGYILNYYYGYGSIVKNIEHSNFNIESKDSPHSEIIKTDSSFIPMWRKEWTVTNGIKTFSFADGNSIVLNIGTLMIMEKIDNNGQSHWVKNYNRTHPRNVDIYNAICKNSTLVFAGDLYKYDYYNPPITALMLKTDTAGNFLMADSIVISTLPYSYINNLTEDTSGNTYIIGRARTTSSNYPIIAKISPANTIVWCKSLYSSQEPDIDQIITLHNGDILIGASAYSSSVGANAIVYMRFTSTGNLVWSRTINNPGFINSMQEITKGDIIITANYKILYDDMNQNCVFRLDSNGTVIWAKTYTQGFAISPAYFKTKNEWYYTAYSSSPFLFNTDSLGNSFCQSSNIPVTFTNYPLTVSSLTATIYPVTIPYLTPTTNAISNQPYKDTCAYLTTSIAEFQNSDKISISPNPFTQTTQITFSQTYHSITLEVYNLQGQRVTQNHNSDCNLINFSRGQLNSGLYFLKMTLDEKMVETRKIVIEE
jgi:hypothetical protein